MALTEQRLLEAEDAPRAVRAPRRDIPLGRSLTLLVAWLVLFPTGVALEPTTNAPEPWWAAVAGVGLLTAMTVTFVGLARRRRWAVGASLIASSIFAAGVFACPATGHHAFGLWWIGEFAASMALVAASGVAYLRASK
jgi:hypothetical protein